MADPLDLRIPVELRATPEMAQYFTKLTRALSAMKEVALLDQTITNPPTQAEVQALSDKVDDISTKIRGL